MYAKPLVYIADFETTVTGEGKDQKNTEVWASAIVGVKTSPDDCVDEEVYIDNSIDSFMARCNFYASSKNIVVYFHNLKFDGSFIIDWLLKHDYVASLNDYDGKWREDKYMQRRSFKCVISDMGQWYTITVKNKAGHKITFKDSLKLLPFSVKAIGKGFGTKHKKLEMEYVGNMKAGGTITDHQKHYITNDVLVVKEALEIMFFDGHDKLTIGSCCKDEYKKSIMQADSENWFPSMTKIKLDSTYGETNAEKYIRHSYKGGWCFVRKDRTNKVFYDGCTADVNSLYPSMMLDNLYPTGKPVFFKGDIPDRAKAKNTVYIIRVKTRFYLKDGFLPTIQIKGSPYYKSTEWLETSDLCFNGKKLRSLKKTDGSIIDLRPTLTLTSVDWELMQKHYNLEDTEILDGCYFYVVDGQTLFGSYINKWAEIKMTSKDALRQEAKLFLNNLYGKFSAKTDATTKLPYLEDGIVKFKLIKDEDPRKEWYIPIGAFITAYARAFTITAAQENYDRFIYADTDSIHCTGRGETLKGIKVHNTKFSHWCLEAHWDKAIFVRQKTYIEHVVENEDGLLEKPYYNIKCAGMDKRPKELLQALLSNQKIETKNDQEKDFLNQNFSIEDFKVGLKVPSKLMTRRIQGGILLVESTFQLS